MRRNKLACVNRKKSRESSRRHSFRPCGEWLESRQLLTVLAQFSGGDLTIGIDDASPVEVTVDSGAVLVNGVAPINLDSTADPVLARSVENIRVSAIGEFSNAIWLQEVTKVNFPNFQAAAVNAGPGADAILGTEFADQLRGGAGDDVIAGGPGDDLIIGGAGSDQLWGGAGNDKLDGAGQIAVTVRNLATAGGTLLTPVFLATTDGVYDFFNAGSPASASLESLAEDGDPTLRINAALNTGRVSQALATAGGPLGPGESRTVEFDASSFDGLAAYLSYASMVIPSNDAFIGNDGPQQLGLFDSEGILIPRIGSSAFIVTGSEVWDAGTEVNDEIPANTAALAQAAPNTGVAENGVVRRHPGFMGSARLGGPTGNVLNAVPNGDFTVAGARMLSIEIVALDGDDKLKGDSGEDVLRGGDGDDVLVGGAGDDELNGGPGQDTLVGDGRIAVRVTNLAPAQGALLTPVFLAIANGDYDFFDAGAPASVSLERLAEDGDPTQRINTAFNSGGVSSAIATAGGPLAPGETRTAEFDVSPHDPLTQYLSYASMVIPSNDAFIGNDDPRQVDLFDGNGNVITRTGSNLLIVTGAEVWDAGTEVNDEVPQNTAALAQAAPNTGVTENGVVRRHPGFMGSQRLGGPVGNILTAIPNGDFTVNGMRIMSIEITELSGDDLLIGDAGTDKILGGAGDDQIIWSNGDGSDRVEGGAGEDRLEVRGSNVADDMIEVVENGGRLWVNRTNLEPFALDVGTVEQLAVDTKGGNDSVVADNLEQVTDLVLVSLEGGSGDDRLDARRIGNLLTNLSGGSGDDRITGGRGVDVIWGGEGDDVIVAGRGNDVVHGGHGNDLIFGLAGDDVIFGDDGNDRIFGGAGNDVIFGGSGNDLIFGGRGDDVLLGGRGNDIIFGGLGDDILRGGSGFDLLFGGPGDDFVLNW